MTHHEYIFSIYFWTFSLEKVFGTVSKNKYFSFLDLSPILSKLSLTKPSRRVRGLSCPPYPGRILMNLYVRFLGAFWV